MDADVRAIDWVFHKFTGHHIAEPIDAIVGNWTTLTARGESWADISRMLEAHGDDLLASTANVDGVWDATDRRWLVLESSREQLRGDLHPRAELPRDIEVDTSWFTRFDGFDQPYAIDPAYRLWAVAANDALTTRAAGGSWDLESAARELSAEDDDATTGALGELVMKAGRFRSRRSRWCVGGDSDARHVPASRLRAGPAQRRHRVPGSADEPSLRSA